MVRGNEHPGLRKSRKPKGWTKHPREHAMAAHGIGSRAGGISPVRDGGHVWGSEVTLRECGEGFPDEGEVIYDSVHGELLRVVSITGHIMTQQWQPNSMAATVEEYRLDPTDLSEAEFDELRNISIIRLDDTEQEEG